MASEDAVAALRGRGSAAGSGSARTQGPEYSGAASVVAGIALTNGLLGLVTLGFYRFWGKTRLRRYLWSRVGFDGDDFEYTGTGKELLIGFLVAIAVLIPLGMLGGVLEVAFPADETVLAISGIVQGLLIAFLVQFAIYRARRYRLTRSQWRGIRAGQSGSAVEYAFVALLWFLLVGITLGLAYPAMRVVLQRYRSEHTWFGTENFTFEGRAGPLFGRWLLAWLLLIPTLGLSYAWYRAGEFRYLAANTRYSGLRFGSELSAGRVIWIWLRYAVVLIAIVVVTVLIATVILPGFFHGLAALSSGDEEAIAAAIENMGSAFIVVLFATMFVIGIAASAARLALLVHPMLGEICRTLTVDGEADFEAILQSQQQRPGRGEGFADVLDVGAI